ncbi:hypothetical protein [Pseudoduganella umbonata]
MTLVGLGIVGLAPRKRKTAPASMHAIRQLA